MDFPSFAYKLNKVIGGKSNQASFTRTIFEVMMNESGPDLLDGTSPDTFKAYFNGNTSISRVASLILANLSDEDDFIEYIESFGDTTAQLLADEFANDIPGIVASNASSMIYELFLEILREASGKKKSTPKSATKPPERTPNDIISEKILASGKALADTWGKAIASLANSIEFPDKQPTGISPYSSEDNLLLKEFNDDYDEILLSLIGENSAASLIDMTLPAKIKSQYDSKWCSKADEFSDPTLKSHIYGLLGELNSISDSFLTDCPNPHDFKSARVKIRNLYVKLHPDIYAGSFPYDAFIDDWNDGEL